MSYYKVHTFECELLSPAFISGADQHVAELRAPSLKGGLRYWWRVLMGNTFDSVKQMKETEDAIFGSTEGKSKVVIQVIQLPSDSSIEKQRLEQVYKDPTLMFNVRLNNGNNVQMSILSYLAVGVSDRMAEIIRPFYKEKTKFKLLIKFAGVESEIEKQVLDALYLFGVFGGIGAKHSNGFGRFKLAGSKRNDNAIELIAKYLKKVESVGLNSFTTLSEGTRIFRFKDNNRAWFNLIGRYGLQYKKFRSTESAHSYEMRKYISRPIVQLNQNERHSKSIFLGIEDGKQGDGLSGYYIYIPYDYSYPGERDKNKLDNYLDAYDEMLDFFLTNQLLKELNIGLTNA